MLKTVAETKPRNRMEANIKSQNNQKVFNYSQISISKNADE